MKILRHGDLLIKEINEFPKNLKKLNHGTLALGEQTGHHHTLQRVKEHQFDLLEDAQGNKFILILDRTDLTHQEHDTVTLEPGKYQMTIEREFDPWTEEINKVKD